VLEHAGPFPLLTAALAEEVPEASAVLGNSSSSSCGISSSSSRGSCLGLLGVEECIVPQTVFVAKAG
jgi:hypothetical protein